MSINWAKMNLVYPWKLVDLMEKIFNLSRCVVVQFSHVQSEGNDEVHQLAQKGI